MYSLSLVVVDKASRKTYHVMLDSLPSVSEMLEGMADFVEQKYGVKFPEIPDLFYAVKNPPAANVHLPCSPTIISPPEAPVLRLAPLAPPAVSAQTQSCESKKFK